MTDLYAGTRVQQNAQKDLRKQRRDLFNSEYDRQRGYQNDAMGGYNEAGNAFSSGQATIGNRTADARSAMMGAMRPSAPMGGSGPLAAFANRQMAGSNAELATRADAMSRQAGLAEGLSRIMEQAGRGQMRQRDAMAGSQVSMGLMGNDLMMADRQAMKEKQFGELLRQIAFGERAGRLSTGVGNVRRQDAMMELNRKKQLRELEYEQEMRQVAEEEKLMNWLNGIVQQRIGGQQ